MMRLVSAKPGEPGALTRIHGGLRNKGVSGRRAFSGWRGRGDCSVSRTTAMGTRKSHSVLTGGTAVPQVSESAAHSHESGPARPLSDRQGPTSFLNPSIQKPKQEHRAAVRRCVADRSGASHGLETRSALVAHGSAIRWFGPSPRSNSLVISRHYAQ